MFTLFVVILAALLVWAAVAFNLLIRDRNRVAQAWSDVDVQLLRRHDLIPRLVEMVKGYAGYERAVLSNIAELRGQSAAASPAARGEAEKTVASGVTKLVALAEAYPDLKASDNFRDLHNKLVDTENQIQFARRYYNGAVNLLNNRIQRFPDLLIANTFGFKLAEFFDLDDPAAARAPGVALAMSLVRALLRLGALRLGRAGRRAHPVLRRNRHRAERWHARGARSHPRARRGPEHPPRHLPRLPDHLSPATAARSWSASSFESATRDGQDEPWRTEPFGNGVRVYLGSASVMLPHGEHTYELVYRTDRQMGFFADHDELYWNVTGNGWDFPIDRATARVVLPDRHSGG